MMDSHTAVQDSQVSHREEVVWKVAERELHDEGLEFSILLAALAVKKVCVVSGEEHDSGAVDERHDPIAEVEPVQSRQILILEFQVHHNDIEHIFGYQSLKRKYSYRKDMN